MPQHTSSVDIKVSHRGRNPHFKDEETEVLREKVAWQVSDKAGQESPEPVLQAERGSRGEQTCPHLIRTAEFQAQWRHSDTAGRAPNHATSRRASKAQCLPVLCLVQ